MLKIGLRRAVRRVHRSAYGGVFFVKLGQHTKFDPGNNPRMSFLLFRANWWPNWISKRDCRIYTLESMVEYCRLCSVVEKT